MDRSFLENRTVVHVRMVTVRTCDGNASRIEHADEGDDDHDHRREVENFHGVLLTG